MVAVTQEMAGGWDALTGFWHRVRDFARSRGIVALGLVFVGAVAVAALVASLVENTILDPNVVILGGELSPNHRWVALTEQIEPGPAVGNIDSAIELRHHDGLLMGPTLDRTFLIKFRSDKVQVLRVRWYTNTVLEIAYMGDSDDIPKLIKEHDGVLIDYRRIERK